MLPPCAFTGRRFDSTLKGLGSNGGDIGYFRARWYDSGTGQWLSPDPKGMPDGPNRYLYVLGSPADGIDPYGTDTLVIVGAPPPTMRRKVGPKKWIDVPLRWSSDGQYEAMVGDWVKRADRIASPGPVVVRSMHSRFDWPLMVAAMYSREGRVQNFDRVVYVGHVWACADAGASTSNDCGSLAFQGQWDVTPGTSYPKEFLRPSDFGYMLKMMFPQIPEAAMIVGCGGQSSESAAQMVSQKSGIPTVYFNGMKNRMNISENNGVPTGLRVLAGPSGNRELGFRDLAPVAFDPLLSQ